MLQFGKYLAIFFCCCSSDCVNDKETANVTFYTLHLIEVLIDDVPKCQLNSLKF